MLGIRALAFAAFLSLPLNAIAQEPWPTRPVRLIVPSSPGGGTDIYARLLGHALSEALKQQFVLDNRPGAGGIIGAEIAAKTAPDGYNFLVSASPALITNPSLYKKLPYNAERDFTPVSGGAMSPLVFVCHPSVPAKKLSELVALGKREPGKLSYGSAGVGATGNLVIKTLEDASGARFLHVPYKGLGQAVQGLLRGEVAFMAGGIVVVLHYVRQEKMRALGISHRVPALPGVPALAESGYAKIESSPSYMVMAPAGTPPRIVQQLNVEINKVMKTPAFREKLDAQGLVPVFDTPEEFAARLKREREQWAAVIRRHQITIE